MTSDCAFYVFVPQTVGQRIQHREDCSVKTRSCSLGILSELLLWHMKASVKQRTKAVRWEVQVEKVLAFPPLKASPSVRSDDERAGDQDDHAIGREGEFGRKEGDSPTSFSRGWGREGRRGGSDCCHKKRRVQAHTARRMALDDPQTQASGTSPHLAQWIANSNKAAIGHPSEQAE